MSNTAAFHSTKPGILVYHDDTRCTEGNNVETRYWAYGTGGRTRRCHHCDQIALNDAAMIAALVRRLRK